MMTAGPPSRVIRRQAEMPSSPGIITSSSTASIRSRASTASISRVFAAADTR
jgi:hypothetical protein